MKYVVAVLLIACATAWSAITPANAQFGDTLTDENIQLIKSRCVSARSSLERLHAADALLRVNLGQEYELISTKLMTRFTSRASLNRLDTTGLARVSADYERELTLFRDAYRDYEGSLTHAIQIDCTRDPEGFYGAIISARERRTAVHEKVVRLNQLVSQYPVEVAIVMKEVH